MRCWVAGCMDVAVMVFFYGWLLSVVCLLTDVLVLCMLVVLLSCVMRVGCCLVWGAS